MNTYVLVSFWLNSAALMINLVKLGADDWPMKKETTLGEHVLVILCGGGFLFWAGYLLWWGPR